VPAGDVLLEDVVLGGAAQLLGLDILLLADQLVEQQQDARWGVDRHRGRYLVQRDPVERQAHVVDRVDRHSGPPDLAERPRIVRRVQLLELDAGVGEPPRILRPDDRRDCAMVAGGRHARRLPALMPASALALTLAAAVVHAVWNLLLSGSKDVRSATAVAVTF